MLAVEFLRLMSSPGMESEIVWEFMAIMIILGLSQSFRAWCIIAIMTWFFCHTSSSVLWNWGKYSFFSCHGHSLVSLQFSGATPLGRETGSIKLFSNFRIAPVEAMRLSLARFSWGNLISLLLRKRTGFLHMLAWQSLCYIHVCPSWLRLSKRDEWLNLGSG